MSDESEQNRSEQPTSYKLNRARGRGMVARSMDLSFFSTLAALAAYLWITGPSLRTNIERTAQHALVFAPQALSSPNEILTATGLILGAIFRPILLLTLAVFAVVLVFELVQTGFVLSSEPLKPDFSRLNPGKNLKRLFSLRLLIETGKGLLKLGAYGGVAFFCIRNAQVSAARAITDGTGLATALVHGASVLLAWFLLAAIAFAILDQLLVRREFLKKMKMSRREVRREVRDREGDHRMKSRRKQLHRDFVKLSQSLKGIRGADVLVTNPTHFAVALKYDASLNVAPIVAAQGTHQVAMRMKRLAFVYGIEVIEDRSLARALSRCELNREVPPDLYQPVSVVYRSIRQKKTMKGDRGV